jgi:hypothetical protein
MAKGAHTVDLWQRPAKLAKVLLSLPNGRGEIGIWEYERKADYKEFIRFKSPATYEADIEFSTISGYAKEAPYLMQLAYWEDKIRHSWGSDEIRKSYEGTLDTVYPHFMYSWKCERKDGVPTVKLSFLRVDLDGRTFVNYEGSKNWGYWMRDNHSQPEGIPHSIAGLTEILDTPIPWEIDYIQTAQEFLDKTGLEKFVKAVRASR